MVTRSFTKDQQVALEELIAKRRIEKVPVDAIRAQAFLEAATDRITQCALLTSPVVQYAVAYDACHDVGEALLAHYGYRTVNRAGQHEALGRFLRVVFTDPPGDQAAQRFDRLRRARNQAHYEAVPVGQAESSMALSTAEDLLLAAQQRIAAAQ